MQQKINLYRFVVKPITSTLTLKKMLLYYGIFIAILLLHSVYSEIRKIQQQKELTQSTLNFDSARNNLIALAAKYPQSAGTKDLINATLPPSCKIKFSAYLEKFAEAIVPGVWLTQMSILNNGKELIIKGQALKAAQVQEYLIQLKTLKFFYPFTIDLKEFSNTEATSTQSLSFQLIAKETNAHE